MIHCSSQWKRHQVGLWRCSVFDHIWAASRRPACSQDDATLGKLTSSAQAAGARIVNKKQKRGAEARDGVRATSPQPEPTLSGRPQEGVAVRARRSLHAQCRARIRPAGRGYYTSRCKHAHHQNHTRKAEACERQSWPGFAQSRLGSIRSSFGQLWVCFDQVRGDFDEN